MSKSTKRIVIFSILFALIAAGAFGFVAQQIVSKRVQLAEQIEALRTERAQEESRIRLQRLATETAADRATLTEYFFQQESQSIDFLNQIETIAPQAGVVLETSGLDVFIDKTDSSEWIQAQFSFSGTRATVERFVRILETVPYVSRLMSVSLTSQTSELWQASVVIQVQILSYENS